MWIPLHPKFWLYLAIISYILTWTLTYSLSGALGQLRQVNGFDISQSMELPPERFIGTLGIFLAAVSTYMVMLHRRWMCEAFLNKREKRKVYIHFFFGVLGVVGLVFVASVQTDQIMTQDLRKKQSVAQFVIHMVAAFVCLFGFTCYMNYDSFVLDLKLMQSQPDYKPSTRFKQMLAALNLICFICTIFFQTFNLSTAGSILELCTVGSIIWWFVFFNSAFSHTKYEVKITSVNSPEEKRQLLL